MEASDYYYHEQFMESFSSASYSKWDDDRDWSSQEWKTDTEMSRAIGATRCHFLVKDTRIQTKFLSRRNPSWSVVNEVMPRDRPGRPDIDSQEGAWPQQFVIGNDEAELELSVESRSFLDRVYDQVRKRQKTIFDEWYRKRRKTFYDVRNVHVCNLGISSIHGKELPEQLSIHREYKRSHTQTNVRLIYKIGVSGLETIGWENHPWKYLSLIGDERIINLQRTKVYVFSDSVLCFGKIFENPQIERCMGTKIGMVEIFFKIQKLWQNGRRANGIRVEYFPGFNSCSSVKKSNIYCSD